MSQEESLGLFLGWMTTLVIAFSFGACSKGSDWREGERGTLKAVVECEKSPVKLPSRTWVCVDGQWRVAE